MQHMNYQTDEYGNNYGQTDNYNMPAQYNNDTYTLPVQVNNDTSTLPGQYNNDNYNTHAPKDTDTDVNN